MANRSTRGIGHSPIRLANVCAIMLLVAASLGLAACQGGSPPANQASPTPELSQPATSEAPSASPTDTALPVPKASVASPALAASPSTSPEASATTSPSPVTASQAPAIPTYNISYQGNGSTGGAVPIDKTAYKTGDTATAAAVGSLVRIHYTFAGWATNANGEPPLLAPGSPVAIKDAPVVLYAAWTVKPNWGISYNCAFQMSGTPPVDDKKYETGDTITLAGNSGKLARIGWVLAGWNTKADGSGKLYPLGSSLTMDSSAIELHGMWTMDLVTVPAGSYRRDDAPGRTSSLSSFRIGRYEVTREQFAFVTGLADASAYPEVVNGPVERLTWYHTLVFCNKLSLKEGLTPVYSINGSTSPDSWGAIPKADNATWNTVKANWSANGYRLPTEQEWQWAAMGASDKTDRAFAGSGGSNAMGDFAWYVENSGATTHPVGSRKPNELGIYDMSGNVAEWCWDWFVMKVPDENLTDYRGADSGTGRSVRGGSWSYKPINIAVNYRNSWYQYMRDANFGFRVVRK